MSSSREHPICCCCPKRVEIKGTYKTIGRNTRHKFTTHARDTITENVTPACNKCYDKYTRNPKVKVIPRGGPRSMYCSLYLTCPHMDSTHGCSGRRLEFMLILFIRSACLDAQSARSELQALFQMTTWKINMMIRYAWYVYSMVWFDMI